LRKSVGRRHKLIKACLLSITVLLFICGLALLGFTYLPFEVVRAKLDAIAADGSADIFTQELFEKLVIRFRFFGAAIFLCSGLLFIARRLLQVHISNTFESFLHFAKDLKQHFRETIRREEKAHFFALLILMLAAIAVRLLFLCQPMRYDESWTFTVFASRPLFVALSNYSEPNNHLFHTLLVHIAYMLLGNKPWVLRLPALVAGILVVPASYMAIRIYFDKHSALLTAGVVASSSALIGYSTNARGYTLFCLIFLLIFALANYIRQNPNSFTWLLFSILSAMGFYTIPLMLYPFGMVVVWLLLSALSKDTDLSRGYLLKRLIVSIIIVALVTFVLYLPVLVASGLKSIISSRFVAPLPWSSFVEMFPRSLRGTWNLWNRDIPQGISILFALGFIVSLVFHKRLSPNRIPVVLALVLWCLPILMIQQVVPPARTWLFFLPLYIGSASAGMIYLLRPIVRKITNNTSFLYATAALILSLFLSYNVVRKDSITRYNESVGLENTVIYLKDYLTPGDRVVALVPLNAPVVYYFNLYGVPIEYFLLDLRSGRRLLAIVNEQFQTLQEVLAGARKHADNFDDPKVIKQSLPIRLYELRRVK